MARFAVGRPVATGFLDEVAFEGHLFLNGWSEEESPPALQLAVERVIFESDDHRETLLEAVDAVRRLDVQVDIIPRLVEGMGPSVSFQVWFQLDSRASSDR